MKTLKEIVGAEPIYHEDGDYYTPSKASLKVMAPTKTNYDNTEYPNSVVGLGKKVLVLCDEDPYLVCENGKRFKTGNHPVETFVVLMHLEKAGFSPEFATISGKPVCIEDWAMPTEDDNVMTFMEEHQDEMARPRTIADVVANLDTSVYEAVFMPGGQGAILGLPESADAQSALQWFLDKEKFFITICHGPAVLLSLGRNGDSGSFPFNGYKIACFPSSGDKIAYTAGYLPGEVNRD